MKFYFILKTFLNYPYINFICVKQEGNFLLIVREKKHAIPYIPIPI